MTDRHRIMIGRSMAAIGVIGSLAGWMWMVFMGHGDRLLDEWLLFNGALAIGFGVITWLVLPTQPRNNSIWMSTWVALFAGLFTFSTTLVIFLALRQGLELDAIRSVTPSDLETGTAVLVMMVAWLFLPGLLAVSPGLLLFPDGQPPSPRWRLAIWIPIAATAVESLALAWIYRPSSTVPFALSDSSADFLRDLGPLVAVTEVLTILAIPISVAGMVVRFRRSSGLQRQQFRVVMWGAAVSAVLVLVALVGDLYGGINPQWPALAFVVVLVSSYGVSIAKYRLYDIDIVISKTFVYGSLGVFITAVYVSFVAGIGALIGGHDDVDVWLGIFATVVIAIAFQPLRRSLQKVANRIVFGRRATPYEVLSTFSQRLAAVDPNVLGQIAVSLCEGTLATSASIWVRRGDTFNLLAASEFERQEAEQSLETWDYVTGVAHDGERLGAVALMLPHGQALPIADDRLVENVAAGLGLALRNIQLTSDLQSRVEELRESRRRVVAIQDQTRQLLERDLHDGAQQRLVALKIKVGIGASIAEKNGIGDIKTILAAVKDETDLTIESLRNLARGIYPPLLEAEGLGPALATQLQRAPIPVAVQSAGIGRHSRELEATVYFCVLEAVQNVIKHARAKSVLVTVADDHEELRFEVRDDGIGFDPSEKRSGHGLMNIADRIDALNGNLEIVSTQDHGTSVIGRIPSSELVSL